MFFSSVPRRTEGVPFPSISSFPTLRSLYGSVPCRVTLTSDSTPGYVPLRTQQPPQKPELKQRLVPSLLVFSRTSSEKRVVLPSLSHFSIPSLFGTPTRPQFRSPLPATLSFLCYSTVDVDLNWTEPFPNLHITPLPVGGGHVTLVSGWSGEGGVGRFKGPLAHRGRWRRRRAGERGSVGRHGVG